jgi:hypothetical protein
VSFADGETIKTLKLPITVAGDFRPMLRAFDHGTETFMFGALPSTAPA